MTEQLLDGPHVHTGLEQVRGIRVSPLVKPELAAAWFFAALTLARDAKSTVQARTMHDLFAEFEVMSVRCGLVAKTSAPLLIFL